MSERVKHIFTVHSPITFLCAYAIIKHEQIANQDIIVLTAGYRVPFKIGKVVPAFQDTQVGYLKKLKNWDVPEAFDKYINLLLEGQYFVAYIDLMHAYQRILVTHERCQQFHFMEEGMASYVLPNSLILLTRRSNLNKLGFRSNGLKDKLGAIIRILRGYTLRMLSLPFDAQSYMHIKGIKLYTFSEGGFPGIDLEKKIILKLEAEDAGIKRMALGKRLESVILWIEDAYAKSYKVPSQNYYRALELSIQRVDAMFPEHKHYIKLKPKQSTASSLMLKALQKSHIEINLLDNQIGIDSLLVRSSNCIAIGCISSVLYYAAIFGHQAFSIFNLIEDKPATVYDDFEGYWEKVIWL